MSSNFPAPYSSSVTTSASSVQVTQIGDRLDELQVIYEMQARLIEKLELIG